MFRKRLFVEITAVVLLLLLGCRNKESDIVGAEYIRTDSNLIVDEKTKAIAAVDGWPCLDRCRAEQRLCIGTAMTARSQCVAVERRSCGEKCMCGMQIGSLQRPTPEEAVICHEQCRLCVEKPPLDCELNLQNALQECQLIHSQCSERC